MIYLISDCHGGENISGIERYLELCTDSDLLIILGDIGLRFGPTEENKRFTNWFLSLNKPIAFIDGNHENHSFINSFPSEIWCGGDVHRLSDTIVHLKRGNIYTIGGKTFFVMGGCKSSSKWKEMGLWYEGEEPTSDELLLAYKNLNEVNNNVDYVLTHKYTDCGNEELEAMTLEGLTSHIDKNVTFRHWYSGHWHYTKFIDNRHTVVYDKPIKIL